MINDRFGHATGDAALRHFTEVAVARLRGASGDDLDRWAERLLTASALEQVFDGG